MSRVLRSVRHADVVWAGGLDTGGGRLEMPSGVGGVTPISWPVRLSGPEAGTSPEELIAAAHAGCFSMALAHALEAVGAPPERVDVRASCTLEIAGEVPGDRRGGPRLTAIELQVRALVPDLEEQAFQAAVRVADAACPVSNALRPGLDVSIDAQLEPG